MHSKASDMITLKLFKVHTTSSIKMGSIDRETVLKIRISGESQRLKIKVRVEGGDSQSGVM